MQTLVIPTSSISIAKSIVKQDGIIGLYRGGLPLLFGGGFMRSAQFGVYSASLERIRDVMGGATSQENKIFGWIDPQVVLAGGLGGIGRGLVEGPIELIKVRAQVDHNWNFKEVLRGSGLVCMVFTSFLKLIHITGSTIFRNTFLFGSFVVYMDLCKQISGDSLGAFWTGAVCSCLAWTSVWPLDVAKSRLQSGNYEGKGFKHLVVDILKSGTLFRGLAPGLIRSAFANGTSMVVYSKVLKLLQSDK
jgi:solute carrier family 25 (mitochondrial carnitine/acylcarnitine transporter), member 20/29